MTQIDDGYIKYDRKFYTKGTALEKDCYQEIETWRKKLFALKLIGEYIPEKIGFGNLSARKNYSDLRQTHSPQFCITGTQTGKYPSLDQNQYTRVINTNIEKMIVETNGPLEASSESLTHAALYMANPEIRYIFHIHSTLIWEGMLRDNLLKTSKKIPYGTIEMAHAVLDIGKKTMRGSFVMEGHQDGVVIYGDDCHKVGEATLELYRRYKCS
jgi:hypothetical protein